MSPREPEYSMVTVVKQYCIICLKLVKRRDHKSHPPTYTHTGNHVEVMDVSYLDSDDLSIHTYTHQI